MKKIVLFCAILITFSAFSQTQWQKLTATKASDFGLSYSLPKTVLVVDVEYTKTSIKAGQYYRYAEKLLGITNPILQDSDFYFLDKVSMDATSAPDKTTGCMVKFESDLPYIILNSEGVLCAVNTNADSALAAKIKPLPQNYVVQEATTNSQLSFTEETLASGSTAKMAELAAKQIFRLRESRLDLLTGDADQRPKDGEGIKVVLAEIDKQEKALTALFTGTTQIEKFYARTKVYPTETDLNHQVLFRFSKHFGYVAADDLSGEPVYIDIKATDRKEFLPDPKAKPNEKHGLAYTIPGKGEVKISYYGKVLFETEQPFTQFGIQTNFPAELFTRKKAPAKVIIHPNTGAIVSLMQ
ncbi:MAG: DUF4831 family protein [Bacteroidales bacterium]